MELKEQLEELKGEIKTHVEAKAKEIAEAQVKEVSGKLEAAEAKVKALEEKQEATQKHADALDVKLQKGGFGQEVKSFAAALKEGLTKGIEAFKAKGGMIEVELDVKAITSASFTQDTNGTGKVIEAMREGGINKDPKRDPFVRDLAFNGTATSDNISWIEKVGETGVPIPLAEEASYPEETVSYQAFSTDVKKIGGMMKVTEEKLSDVNWMLNEIQAELIQRHDIVVDTQIFSGSGAAGNLKGVKTYATAFAAGSFATAVKTPNRADVLRVAYNQVITNLFKPTAIVLHPSDVAKMELQKDANGQYLMPPFASVDGTKIKGLPVIENIGQTEGDFLIGDFSKLGVFSKGGVYLEIGYDGSDFSKDLRTVKLRERLAVRVKGRDLGAFVKGTFSTAITAITAP